MRILSIDIHNILSIESIAINFPDSGLTLIEGWNNDASRSNGAGKTAIFNSLCFALYDKIPRKVTASEILRRGTKSGKVNCKVDINGEVWEVVRSRPKGAVFLKNEQIQHISQEEWEDKLKLSYEQFLLSIYTAQNTEGSQQRFLLCNDVTKKNFLLDLFNLEQFTEYKKNIDSEVKSLNNSILDFDSKIAISKSRVEAYSESLVDTLNLTNKVEEFQLKIADINKELVPLSNINKPNLNQYEKLEHNLISKQYSINSVRTNISTLMDRHRKLQSKICEYDPFKKCEKCGSSTTSEEAKQLHANEQDELKEEISATVKKIEELNEVTKSENEVKELLRKLKDKKNEDSVDFLSAQKRITELTYTLQNLNNSISNNLNSINNNEEILNKINSLNSLSTQLEIKKNEINKESDLLKTISSIFSPIGAQAYILDSVIDVFNEHMANYISILWPTATYRLNSYKETQKGDISAKFSETLIIDSNEVSIGSLSGGELKALSLCVDFSLLDVLSSLFSVSCNPIILDEPFDGVDSAGRELVIELLKKLSETRAIIVVDHMTETQASFDNVIKVVKTNGISSLCKD